MLARQPGYQVSARNSQKPDFEFEINRYRVADALSVFRMISSSFVAVC